MMRSPSSGPLAVREVRDTLFMLGVIAWTLAPHWWRLSPWVPALCLGVLLWRGRLAWRQAPLPPALARLTVALLAAGLTWWDQRTLVGRDAGVILLVLLMTLKTLELRARRDALVVFFLGFFLVLMQFLYSQTLLTALFMAVAVWGWLTALTLAHMPAGRPPLQEAARLAGRAALVGTPAMVALFLMFPRIGPLWSMPGDGARTGLSDQLRLGEVAELAQDDSIALRVRFSGTLPAAGQLYFRGPVLTTYDGRQWSADPPRGGPPGTGLGARSAAEPVRQGQPWSYELTVEPLRVPWLPLLEHTLDAPVSQGPTPAALQALPAHPDRAGQWRLPVPLADRLRLQAQAWPEAVREPNLPLRAQRDLVELPPGHHPRTLAWAAELRARPELREADARTAARTVLAHIRSQPFQYTLAPGPYLGDSIDEFWFDRRAGFCEHYAAAFVVILRAMDVPARIVTGYQGSDPVPVDGYLVVRQSHAHAWAEFWQPGEGWVRADPTAAVAPERINRSRSLRPAPGLVAGAIDAVTPGMRAELRRWLEQLDNRWNQWVLGYGRQQQFKLLADLGWDGSGDPLELLQALVLGLASLGLVGAAWAWWDGRRRSPWQATQAQLIRALARVGVAAQAHDSPARMARALQARHGDVAADAAQALQALEAWRYARSRADAAAPSWRQLSQQALQALQRLPRVPEPPR